MKKRIFSMSIFFSISLIAFLATETVFAAHTCSDSPLTTFSDGLTLKMVTIPAGGGTVEAGRIRLPMGSIIAPTPCSIELTIDKGVAAEGGTPFIWVPLSGNNQLVQIKTTDGTIVHTFSNGADNCTSTSPVAFSNPSRITVLPGAAVWVANRGNGTVTRLGLKTDCTGDDCYECKGTYSDIGDGPRGATYDKDGNIWVGAYDNAKICKYKSDGTLITCKNSGCKTCCKTYGMIGDISGNVWVSDRVNSRLCQCSGDISCGALASTTGIGMYGIGMDNEGDIWFAGYEQGKVYETDHSTLNVKTCGNVGQTSGPRGVAVDGNNKIWVANSGDNKVYVIDQNCNSVVSTTTGYSNVIGVAIDDQNNGWIVSQGDSRVLKYQLSGNTLTRLLDIPVSGNPYNYSDMTGFRTPKISVTIGNFGPITAMSYPQIINDANYLGFSATLNTTFQNCSCPGCVKTSESACGNVYCEVPITISSSFLGGDYTLSDLKIHYDEPPSKITGGLVPCGRNCDDPSTTIKEDAPCTLCHLFVLAKRLVDFLLILVISVAILMFVVGGIMLVFVAEDPQRANQAKALLTTAAIGLVVIFAAWLIVNVLVFFLVEGKAPFTTEIGKIFSQPWNQINCPVE